MDESETVPVLWLCGPMGVGKSTLGWEIYSQLSRQGVRLGLLELDLIGICFPAGQADLEALTVRNFQALWPVYVAAGIRALVVTRDVDSAARFHNYADGIQNANITVCRLRADYDELRNRYLERGLWPDKVHANVAEAERMDRDHFAMLCVDITDTTVSDAALMVRKEAADWPADLCDAGSNAGVECGGQRAGAHVEENRLSMSSGAPFVLWLAGPRGVGKSTIGFKVAEELWRAGTKAAFVDLDQLGYVAPSDPGDPANARLKARALAALMQGFRESKARCVIVAGDVEPENAHIYSENLPFDGLTRVRLWSVQKDLIKRILIRGRLKSSTGALDPLKGLSGKELREIARLAYERSAELDEPGSAEIFIDTSGTTADEVAADLLNRLRSVL